MLSGTKLGGAEFKGTMDAMCKLWIGNPSDKSKGQTYSTTTIKGTINPIWAESFAFKLYVALKGTKFLSKNFAKILLGRFKMRNLIKLILNQVILYEWRIF